MVEQDSKIKWYYTGPGLVFVFLCVGPLALIFLWLSPRFNSKIKIIVSIVALVLSYGLWIITVQSFKSINARYQEMMQMVQ
ncbi:MAG: hypothetical protein V1650_04480 [Candidatus Omnitrophota bacterium]